MVLADGIFLGATALGLAIVVAWGVRRYYRSRLITLAQELEAARAASAHHALWAEEQRIELSSKIRELQDRLAHAEMLNSSDTRRSRSPWTPAAATSRLTAHAQSGAPNRISRFNHATTANGVHVGVSMPAASIHARNIPVAAMAEADLPDLEPAEMSHESRRRHHEPVDFADTEPLPRR